MTDDSQPRRRGRPRKWPNEAARKKAYRQDQAAKGASFSKRSPDWHGPKSRSKFAIGQFIAVDGEGWDVGPLETHEVDGGSSYQSRDHRFTLLAASNGDELYRGGKRLDTEDCLDFLCDLQMENKNAILVAFASGYDCNHMLMHGLPRDVLFALSKGTKVEWHGKRCLYEIEYRPRKSLKIWRHEGHQPQWVRRGEAWAKKAPVVATLWDVWGFFQGSFVSVLEKWLGDIPEIDFIRDMKSNRSEFEPKDLPIIREYNQMECALLVRLMERVREAVSKLGLSISRWDGAGAIAAAMNAKHKVKDCKAATPPEVFEAARIAYSGGHIEACQIGKHDGSIHHYDVNSAYPAEFIELPDLTRGTWVHETGPDIKRVPHGFTLVRIEWKFENEGWFYPLFWRDMWGSIQYPSEGHGWYWFPEYQVACEYAAMMPPLFADKHKFIVHEYWHFKPSTSERPFGWVRDYYKLRQQYVQAEKAGLLTDDTRWMAGAEKVIKLGLNSLYGKTAQQVGGREDQPPPYFQIEWAGYVTSGCRAKLMQAAISNHLAIISFATDGVFATAPLAVDAPKEKTLGLWEYQHHDNGMVIVMPGVYWTYDDAGKVNAYSRGFDKDVMGDARFILEAWRKGKRSIEIGQTRLIGIGSAVMSDVFWQMRGRFVSGVRELQLDGLSRKRYGIDAKAKPHLGLVRTYPQENVFGNSLTLSAKYKIAWLDDDGVSESDPDHLRETMEETDVTDD